VDVVDVAVVVDVEVHDVVIVAYAVVDVDDEDVVDAYVVLVDHVDIDQAFCSLLVDHLIVVVALQMVYLHVVVDVFVNQVVHQVTYQAIVDSKKLIPLLISVE
jgi:hypothetical protein